MRNDSISTPEGGTELRLVIDPGQHLGEMQPALAVCAPPEFPLPWHGCRVLLAHFTEIDFRRVSASLPLYREPLRHVLDHYGTRPWPLARTPTFLAHNQLVSQPFRDAWAALLAPLAHGRTILVNSASQLDLESLQVLSALARARCLALVVGHSRSKRPTELHSQRSFDLADTWVTELLAGSSSSSAAADPLALPTHHLFETESSGALELRAWRALDEGAADPELLVGAVRACFDARGYLSVIRLGERSLGGAQDLSPAQLAELHTLVAVAAYSRHIESGNDREIGEFLEMHYCAALALEDRPVERAHLMQRLGMLHSRRHRRADIALPILREGLSLVRNCRAASASAGYVEAWLLNALSYTEAVAENEAASARDIRAAVARLEELTEDDSTPPRELQVSRLVLLDNLAQVAEWQGNTDEALAAQRRLDDEERRFPGIFRLAGDRWLRLLCPDPTAVAKVEAIARDGLQQAVAHDSPVHLERFATALGESLYRQGRAAEAIEPFAQAKSIRERIGTASDVRTARMNLALANLRGGCPERALPLLQAQLGDAQSQGERAQLHGWLALALAYSGATDAAQPEFRSALDAAAGQGAGVMLRVAWLLSEAFLVLGRSDEARSALEHARKLWGPAPATPTELLLLAAELSCGMEVREPGDDPGAVLLLGLRVEAELWWVLPRLAPWLKRWPPGDEVWQACADLIAGPRGNLAHGPALDPIAPASVESAG
jgi:tetratricopeptide (TPR) repeat protein